MSRTTNELLRRILCLLRKCVPCPAASSGPNIPPAAAPVQAAGSLTSPPPPAANPSFVATNAGFNYPGSQNVKSVVVALTQNAWTPIVAHDESRMELLLEVDNSNSAWLSPDNSADMTGVTSSPAVVLSLSAKTNPGLTKSAWYGYTVAASTHALAVAMSGSLASDFGQDTTILPQTNALPPPPVPMAAVDQALMGTTQPLAPTSISIIAPVQQPLISHADIAAVLGS